MSDWKQAAASHLSEFAGLVPPADRPGEFLAAVVQAFSGGCARDYALDVRFRLDRFIGDCLAADLRFALRRGVNSNVRKLKERLDELTPAPPGDAQRAVAFNDAFAEQLLAAPACREALEWLGEPGGRRTLGELASTRASVQLVRRFYTDGATQVFALEIAAYPDGVQNSGKLIIRLPSSPERRAAVLQRAARLARSRGWDDDAGDHGQRYVFLMLD